MPHSDIRINIRILHVRASGRLQTQTSGIVREMRGVRAAPGGTCQGGNGQKIVKKNTRANSDYISSCLVQRTKKLTIANTSRSASYKRQQPNYTLI